MAEDSSGSPRKIVLTEAQRKAVDRAVGFLKDPKSDGHDGVFRVGGYAGVGKTVMARYIVAEAPGKAAVCSLTGKACAVLRSKGLEQAQTIHSTIYNWSEHARQFLLKEPKDLQDTTYFLIDEGSMVNEELWDDLRSFGLPIVVIGDPGQLEPVGDDPHLMREPDVVLDQIHRQAEDNPIIQAAHMIRHDEMPDYGDYDGKLRVARAHMFFKWLTWADQALCGFNKTRARANEIIREQKGLTGRLAEGDRLICLKNNPTLRVWNGQMFHVHRILEEPDYEKGRGAFKCRLEDELGQMYENALVWDRQLGSVQLPRFEDVKFVRHAIVADYGFCTTVHKFQGSEAGKVVVLDQQCGKWEPRRWRYTAITRAADQLAYCIDFD
jgi:exodeoxyribonuclease-5